MPADTLRSISKSIPTFHHSRARVFQNTNLTRYHPYLKDFGGSEKSSQPRAAKGDMAMKWNLISLMGSRSRPGTLDKNSGRLNEVQTVVNNDISILIHSLWQGFSGGSVVKNPIANMGDTEATALIPGWGRSPGEGNSNPPQYSCLEKFHGHRSLAGCSPWGLKESNMTEELSTHALWQNCCTNIWC